MEEQRQRVVLGDDARTIRDPYTCDIVFFDVETTGLAPEYHDLIEIGAIRVRQTDFAVLREYSVKVRPNTIDRASPEALRVNGYTAEEWVEAVSLHEAMLEMLDMVRDAALCAHKAAFDEYFLYHAMKRCSLIPSDGAAPWFYVFDTLSNGQMLLRRQAPRLRGSLLAEALGVDPEPEPHTALRGAQQCFDIYRRQRELMDDPIISQRLASLITAFHTT